MQRPKFHMSVIWKSAIALVVLAIAIVCTSYSCTKYSEAMAALNKNADYVESKTLNNAASDISSASSELDYSPERVWQESYTTCNARDEEGDCTSRSTHWRTRRTPEDCPDPSDTKSYIARAVNSLEMTGGSGEKGLNNENKASIETILAVSASLPDGHELCYIDRYHASESTFAPQRHKLALVTSILSEHADERYAKVPSDLKKKRNWSVFGLVMSTLGILGSFGFGIYSLTGYADGTSTHRTSRGLQ